MELFNTNFFTFSVKIRRKKSSKSIRFSFVRIFSRTIATRSRFVYHSSSREYRRWSSNRLFFVLFSPLIDFFCLQQHNFNKFQWDVDVENQSFTYDYGSIMHYPTNAFSKNLKPTITPKQANVSIGQRNKLSPTDIAEIRHYYEC